MFKYSKDKKLFKEVLKKYPKNIVNINSVRFDGVRYVGLNFEYNRDTDTLEACPDKYIRAIPRAIKASEFNFVIDGVVKDHYNVHNIRYSIFYCYNLSKDKATL